MEHPQAYLNAEALQALAASHKRDVPLLEIAFPTWMWQEMHWMLSKIAPRAADGKIVFELTHEVAVGKVSDVLAVHKSKNRIYVDMTIDSLIKLHRFDGPSHKGFRMVYDLDNPGCVWIYNHELRQKVLLRLGNLPEPAAEPSENEQADDALETAHPRGYGGIAPGDARCTRDDFSEVEVISDDASADEGGEDSVSEGESDGERAVGTALSDAFGQSFARGSGSILEGQLEQSVDIDGRPECEVISHQGDDLETDSQRPACSSNRPDNGNAISPVKPEVFPQNHKQFSMRTDFLRKHPSRKVAPEFNRPIEDITSGSLHYLKEPQGDLNTIHEFVSKSKSENQNFVRECSNRASSGCVDGWTNSEQLNYDDGCASSDSSICHPKDDSSRRNNTDARQDDFLSKAMRNQTDHLRVQSESNTRGSSVTEICSARAPENSGSIECCALYNAPPQRGIVNSKNMRDILGTSPRDQYISHARSRKLSKQVSNTSGGCDSENYAISEAPEQEYTPYVFSSFIFQITFFSAKSSKLKRLAVNS